MLSSCSSIICFCMTAPWRSFSLTGTLKTILYFHVKIDGLRYYSSWDGKQFLCIGLCIFVGRFRDECLLVNWDSMAIVYWIKEGFLLREGEPIIVDATLASILLIDFLVWHAAVLNNLMVKSSIAACSFQLVRFWICSCLNYLWGNAMAVSWEGHLWMRCSNKGSISCLNSFYGPSWNVSHLSSLITMHLKSISLYKWISLILGSVWQRGFLCF